MALSGSVINKVTIDLICELLNLPEHDNIASELDASDVNLLFEFLLDVSVVYSASLCIINYLLTLAAPEQ